MSGLESDYFDAVALKGKYESNKGLRSAGADIVNGTH